MREIVEPPPIRDLRDARVIVAGVFEGFTACLQPVKEKPRGGGDIWFLPGTPMDGKVANAFQALCRKIYEDHGMDYCVMNVASARFARGLHVITFNREDEDECRRADACYKAMARALADQGVYVGRAPLDYHDFHMEQAIPAFRDACGAVKRALDPAGVIAPGRYGIEA